MLPKSIKNVTLDDLKTDNIDLYNQIFALGEEPQKAVISNLHSELNILRFGIKLNKIDLAESLIKDGKTELEAKTQIVETAGIEIAEANKNNSDRFFKSAPPAAGSAGSSNEHSEKDIMTQTEAVEHVMKRDNLKSRPEAIRKARREFSQLFVNTALQEDK